MHIIWGEAIVPASPRSASSCGTLFLFAQANAKHQSRERHSGLCVDEPLPKRPQIGIRRLLRFEWRSVSWPKTEESAPNQSPSPPKWKLENGEQRPAPGTPTSASSRRAAGFFRDFFERRFVGFR